MMNDDWRHLKLDRIREAAMRRFTSNPRYKALAGSDRDRYYRCELCPERSEVIVVDEPSHVIVAVYKVCNVRNTHLCDGFVDMHFDLRELDLGEKEVLVNSAYERFHEAGLPVSLGDRVRAVAYAQERRASKTGGKSPFKVHFNTLKKRLLPRSKGRAWGSLLA